MSNQGPRRTPSTDSSSTTSTASLKGSRTARFAEATSVNSPIDGPTHQFATDRSQVYQPQPADVGFGYLNEKSRESVYMPASPRSPMKSAMKSPGAPSRKLENPLSPTFREEEMLEKREKATDKEQAKDLKIKTRVRMAKAALRGVNFSCSLIILSMVSTSFAIFNATRALPQQSGAPSWASDTNTLPQKIILVAASISLIICVGVFIAYCRGGHRRAEKVGVYYTLFAVGWFILSMIMWAAAAGVLQFSKDNSNNRDMWGWSCVQNHRSEIYSEKVDYALVCRLQNWTLICIIIEIVVEVISITLYSVIFYRYYTKRRLTKSMDSRDKARTDLYLAQLRNQSAPNTPGFGGPKSPALSNYALSPRFPEAGFQSMSDGSNVAQSPFSPGGKSLVEPQSGFATRNGLGSSPSSPTSPDRPFKLQMPPQKAPSATPKQTQQSAFGAAAAATSAPPKGSKPVVNAPMAPGEIQYEAVAIPEAYAGAALKSPPPAKTTFR